MARRVVDLRIVEQRAQAGLVDLLQGAQTERDDDAVLAVERDGVCDGCDGDELEQGRQKTIADGGFVDGLHTGGLLLRGGRAGARRQP